MMRLVATVFFCSVFFVVKASKYEPKLDSFLQGYGNVVSPRIVGGQEATPHAFSYQAALFIKISSEGQTVFCGGSLISEVHILTAAHCVDSALEVLVILGAHNVSEREASQQLQFSKNITIHKKWNPSTLSNDIAIITLPNRVEYTFAVKPILLPKKSDQFKSFAFTRATVSGWGKSKDSSTEISPVLRYVQAKIVPLIICSTLYHNVFSKKICLEGLFGRSPCSGDSGGPLVIVQNKETVQQGIASFAFGFGCQKGFPSGFTKVSSYLDWIQSNTGIMIRQ